MRSFWLALLIPMLNYTGIAHASGIDCKFRDAMAEVDTYASVPTAIREKVGEMAERGARWQATDVITSDPLPSMRFIRAGHRGANWFVWYERGGIGHNWEVAVDGTSDRKVEGGLRIVQISIDWQQDQWISYTDVCSLIDGMMSGKYPPYPRGVMEVNPHA